VDEFDHLDAEVARMLVTEHERRGNAIGLTE